MKEHPSGVWKQWHPDNDDIDNYTHGSKKKVKWLCELGHEWEAMPLNRVRGTGCPICTNRAVLIGYNDLPHTNPELMPEWDDDRSPSEFTAGSETKINWKCSKGHNWKASPATRVRAGTGCSKCRWGDKYTGHKKRGTLKDEYPSVFKELVSKDEKLTFGSTARLEWECSKGHRFFATPRDRALKNTECPYCVNRLIKAGVNDLSVSHPDIYEQLVNKEPLAPKSNKVVAWKCDENHAWETTASARTAGHKCPYCQGRLPIIGQTDLATVSPSLYDEMVEKQDITSKSNKVIEWKCSKGHTWKATPAHRMSGTGCPSCSGRVAIPGKTSIDAVKPGISDMLVDKTLATKLTYASNKSVEWKCECGDTWKAPVYYLTLNGGTRCPKCSRRRSAAEESLASYVESLGFTIERNDRTVIPPKELDIYIPEKNIAIEYNGLYWHTERIVGQGLHYSKYRACKEAGIQLIAIWEDDWILKQDIVKKMIAAKLGINSGSIGARKTKAVDLNYTQAEYFLDKYHIQGSARGTHYKGLTHDDELIAVAVFRDVSGRVYLDRYASSMTVSGGLDKMMKSLPYKEFITFADHSVSNGKLYEATGWEFDKELRPDYSYIYGGVRHHKFKFRKARFEHDPYLLFEPGLTESQLAELNDIERVYDYGKTRYVKRFE